MDAYISFDLLKKYHTEGVDYLIETHTGNSGIAVMAPHGGGIEPGTASIARHLAEPHHTYWSFRGIRPDGNKLLHITSTRFDEPAALNIAQKAKTVITIHGCGENSSLVYVGGRDEYLKKRIQESLLCAGFKAERPANTGLGGKSPENLCNRCISGRGVQLEIARGLRKSMFSRYDVKGSPEKTTTFYCFTDALKKAIEP